MTKTGFLIFLFMLTMFGAVVGFIRYVAVNDTRTRDEFIADCSADHKRYECTKLYQHRFIFCSCGGAINVE